MDDTPPVKKKYRCDGSRLIETYKGKYCAHLLSQGYSLRQAAAESGVSNNGAESLRRWNAEHKTRLEGINTRFRDKARVVAEWAMDSITPEKLHKADVVAAIRVAKDAGVMGGMVTTTPTPGAGQLLVLQQFNLLTGQPSISAADQEPRRQATDTSRDHMLANESDTPVLEADSAPADHSQS